MEIIDVLSCFNNHIPAHVIILFPSSFRTCVGSAAETEIQFEWTVDVGGRHVMRKGKTDVKSDMGKGGEEVTSIELLYIHHEIGNAMLKFKAMLTPHISGLKPPNGYPHVLYSLVVGLANVYV